MKYKTLTACLFGLVLSATSAMACSVYLKMINHSGKATSVVDVTGPYFRMTQIPSLKNNSESTSHHFSGKLLSCHGIYALSDGSDGSKGISPASGRDRFGTASKDGTLTATFTNKCYLDRTCVVDWTFTPSK